MRGEWTHRARADLREILERVALDDPAAARALVRQLVGSESRVVEHPLAGRVVPEFEVANLRERIVPPYRVIYQVLPDRVVFLTVVHSRQDLTQLQGLGDQR